MPVDPLVLASVIGKKGATIKKLQAECDAMIELAADDADATAIVIAGTAAMIAQSVGVVGALLEPLQVVRIALLDPSEAGKIVGQGGKTINAISSEWRVRVDMIDATSTSVQLGRRGKSKADRPQPTHVAIVGTPQGVEGAGAAIKAILR